MQIQPRIQTLSRIASPERAGFPVLVRVTPGPIRLAADTHYVCVIGQ